MRDKNKRHKMLNWFVKHGATGGVTFVQETHTTADSQQKWEECFKGEIIMSHGANNSKGVAILMGNKLDQTITASVIDQKGRYIILLVEIQGSNFLLINSYQPNDEKSQVEVLKEIIEKLVTIDYPVDTSIIWGGDFNLVFDLDLETSGGNPSLKHKSIETMQTILMDSDLCDIWRVRNPDVKRFTWSGCAQGKKSNSRDRLFRRLDYFFVSDSLQPFIDKTSIIPAPSTDHHAITLKFCSFNEGKKGPSFWKFNNSLLRDEVYVKEVSTIIENKQKSFRKEGIASPQNKWELIKYEIRKFSISYSKTRARKFRAHYKDIENKIQNVESFRGWEKDADLLTKHGQYKLELENYSNYVTEGIILRSRCKWYEEGEKNTKYFLTLEKRNKAKTHIRKLVDGDQTIIDPRDIQQKITYFYSSLYSSKSMKSEEECLTFLSTLNTPKISVEERMKCEGCLSLKECYDALQKLGSSKCPGNDGLTKELYMTLWPLLGPLLVDCLNECFEKGCLTTSQRQAVITMIAKPGKDNRYLKNWRPISLINVDVKICTTALSARIISILPSVIHPNQVAYIKDRNIEEPIKFIEDLLDHTLAENESLLLFAADFEKAFDSIEHNFIFATLNNFGFGEQFINWIRIMFNKTQSCVLNNGTATNFFDITRGTKQGDPISPYLFILAIEIMAIMIRENRDIKGFNLDKDTMLKILLFADDTTFFLQNPESLKKVLEDFSKFQLYSSLKINVDKSEVGWIGPRTGLTITKPGEKELKWIDFHVSGVKILGVHFSHNKLYREKNNFERIFENFRTTLSIWNSRNLTPYGKIQILRALGLSKLYYICTKTGVKESFIKEVKSEVAKFVWNGKKPKIKYNTLIGNYEVGGLKLPDFESMIKASHFKWATKLLDNTYSYWKVLPLRKLRSIGGPECIRENFDCTKIPKDLSLFYTNVLNAWATFCGTKIDDNRTDILKQSLWNNIYIKIDIDKGYMQRLVKKGILLVSDLWDPTTGFNWEWAKMKGLLEVDYMSWRGLISAIPAEWKRELKKNMHMPSQVHAPQRQIEISGKKININKIKTKQIYDLFIDRKFTAPTSQRRWQQIFSDISIDWESAYCLIYKTTIDTKLRWFQYKILMNCLYLNKDLVRFKLQTSPLCSFCQSNNETIEHIFVYCKDSATLYLDITNWLKPYNIKLPELTSVLMVTGLHDNNNVILVNFILLLYKYFIYRCRNSSLLSLKGFQTLLKHYEKLEYTIAYKNNKLSFHLTKFEKLRNALDAKI